MSTFPDSLLNASFVTDSSSGDEDELMPWKRDNFVPRTSSGRQRSPNNIRNQLLKYYMDGSLETEAAIIESMGVSYDDFYEFMNPSKAYKTNQWAALENKTYWAAARWLEQAKHEANINHQASKKRKTVSDRPSLRDTLSLNPLSNRGRRNCENRAATPPLVALVDDVEVPSVVPIYDSSREVFKKIKEIPTLTLAPFSNRGRPNKKAKDNAQNFMKLVNEVELPSIVPVYDSCHEVTKKINDFLKLSGVTKISFCDALAVNQNSMNTFLAGENQDQCGNITYRRAYAFFEKKRILEGEPKSPCRRRREKKNPMGFSLTARGFSKDRSHLAVAGLLEWAWGSSRWSDDTSELCH